MSALEDALADWMEEDSLAELERIDGGYYATDSATNDTHDREDAEE